MEDGGDDEDGFDGVLFSEGEGDEVVLVFLVLVEVVVFVLENLVFSVGFGFKRFFDVDDEGRFVIFKW